ncbi:MAG: PulJ/GspJ family protein, partial [Planctomycetota bacterium]
MSGSSGKRGFTLVEILVAMAIIVTIVSMVYGSYFATSKSAETCKAKMALSQQVRKVLQQMARQIRCSYADKAEELTDVAGTISREKSTVP